MSASASRASHHTEEISVPVPPPPTQSRPGECLPPWLYNAMNKVGLIELMLVHKWNFVYGLVGFTTLYLVQEYFMTVTCNLVGFVLPAIKSVKAIETPCKEDDTEWLMYWVVFAAFSVVEFFSDLLLSWFPFYFLGKCLFLLWCMSPVSWNGSAFLYRKFIRRAVLSHEMEIDRVLSRVNAGANNIISTAQEVAAKNSTAEAMGKVAKSMLTMKPDSPVSAHSVHLQQEVPPPSHSLKKDHTPSKSSVKHKRESSVDSHVGSTASLSKKDE